MVFKILLSKINVLNIELDKEGESQNGTNRWIHPRSAVVFVADVVLGGGVGGRSGSAAALCRLWHFLTC